MFFSICIRWLTWKLHKTLLTEAKKPIDNIFGTIFYSWAIFWKSDKERSLATVDEVSAQKVQKKKKKTRILDQKELSEVTIPFKNAIYLVPPGFLEIF